MAWVVDPKRRNAPAPNDRTRAKTRDWPFKFTIDQTFDASRDVRVELRSSGRIAFVADRIDDVSDRLFGIVDVQRPRAASMIWRARCASTTRPCRYDSSAASMPASSSAERAPVPRLRDVR